MKSTRPFLTIVPGMMVLVSGPAMAQDPPAQQSKERKSSTVASRDGTKIAYEQRGTGPAVILVSCVLSDRSDGAGLAELLAPRFTVINFDRRGRGESGDKPPYAVEREVEDIEALIDHAGGKAFVFGHSSGAVLALEAANRLPGKVTRALLFEPPFVVDDSRPPVTADERKTISERLAKQQRSEAVEYFMTRVIGVPPDFVASMKQGPSWVGMEKLAHTIPYDLTVLGDTQAGKPLPADRWKTVRAALLIVDGEKSEVFLHKAADSLAALLPRAGRRTLKGQDHAVVFTDPGALAPVMIDFFGARSPALKAPAERPKPTRAAPRG